MLYKYYRYILILKIVLLVVGGYMLLHEWDVAKIEGGTLFLVNQQPWTASSLLDSVVERKLPTPWAMLSTFSWQYTVQIPWTYDTGYVLRYLKKPIPEVAHAINANIYTDNCQKKVSLTNYKWRNVENCNLGIHYDTITAIILITLWLIL